jgi:hypothetical protein
LGVVFTPVKAVEACCFYEDFRSVFDGNFFCFLGSGFVFFNELICKGIKNLTAVFYILYFG